MLPVGTNQDNVPEDAYNQLYRIKEALLISIDNYYRAHPIENPYNNQNAGKKKDKRTLRKKKVIKKNIIIHETLRKRNR